MTGRSKITESQLIHHLQTYLELTTTLEGQREFLTTNLTVELNEEKLRVAADKFFNIWERATAVLATIAPYESKVSEEKRTEFKKQQESAQETFNLVIKFLNDNKPNLLTKLQEKYPSIIGNDHSDEADDNIHAQKI